MGMRRKPTDPLRRILGESFDPRTGRLIEHLDCGHDQAQRQDIFGPTNAYRRRCRACGREARARPDEKPDENSTQS